MEKRDNDIYQSNDLILKREWLECNRLGAYSNSTICGMNNKRYHGLLVVPCNGFGKQANVLAKFEESIFIGNRLYEISTNCYEGGIYPDGYKYLKKFRLSPFPKFYYYIEDRRIEKTIFLQQNKNTLIIRYALKNQGKPVKLVLKPMIAGRFSHDLAKDVQGITTDSYLAERVVKIAPRKDIPELQIFFTKGEYVPTTLWYYGYFYAKDEINNNKQVEDLFNPGFFTYILKPYDTFELFISLDEVTDFDYESIYRKEKEARQKTLKHATDFPTYVKHLVKVTGNWLIPAHKSNASYMPNYPQATSTLRETLISYFGLLYMKSYQKTVRDEIIRLASLLNEGLLPVSFPSLSTGTSYRTSDCSLIYINLMYMYHQVTNDTATLELLYTTTRDIIENYQEGTRYQIREDKDGLIAAGDARNSTSLMPLLSKDGQVLRYGKLCEINALWYNALKSMEFFCRTMDKNRLAGKYAKFSEKTRHAFVKKFWCDEHDSLYDIIRENFRDTTFRLLQVIPLALPFTMLDREKGQRLLKKIERELFTPYGLRTLSNVDSHYTGRIDHMIGRSHPSYYTGSVWPWTIGLYVNAVLNYRGVNMQVVKTLLHFLSRFKTKMTETAIGYIPEVFAGDEPYRASGNSAYSINTTELFRAYTLLNQIKVHD